MIGNLAFNVKDSHGPGPPLPCDWRLEVFNLEHASSSSSAFFFLLLQDPLLIFLSHNNFFIFLFFVWYLFYFSFWRQGFSM